MTIRNLFTATCLSAGLALSAQAQVGSVFESSEDAPGSYVAGIWVDPDGCQHWVMDLGIEGMMDSVLTRDGLPVCSGGFAQPQGAASASVNCGTLSGDQGFASGSAQLSATGLSQTESLGQQLLDSGVRDVTVIGYTDATGSTSANDELSQARAVAVASALQGVGVNITNAYGQGAANPVADNATEAGRAANRRVELICQ